MAGFASSFTGAETREVAFPALEHAVWCAASNDFVATRGFVRLKSGVPAVRQPRMRFVSSGLKQIVGARIKSVALSWTSETSRHPDCGEIVFLDGSGERVCAVPLTSKSVAWKPNESVLFSEEDVAQAEAWKLLERLETGVSVGLGGKGADMSLVYDRRHPATGSGDTFLRLKVRFSSDAERLTLAPLVKILPDEYVTTNATGDQLVYCGKPLRLNGVNWGRPSSYRESEGVVRRLGMMNVNAVRLWIGPCYPKGAETNAVPRYYASVKGDGSVLDNADYFIWLCEQNGIFVHGTTTGGHLPPTPNEYADVGRDGYWLFPELIERKKLHQRNFLNHVNPYSGRKIGEMSVFATYELSNEDGFVVHLTSGCFRRWNPSHQAYLRERYRAFLAAKYGRPSDRDPADDFAGADFLEFVMRQQMAVNAELEANVRTCAAPGKGISIAPIVRGTHPRINLNTHYVHQCGQIASVGAYQAFSTKDKSAPFYPWDPLFTRRAQLYNMMYETPPNKIFTIYEHHHHGPYDYRAEWMPTVVMVGGGLGWDAMYLFSFHVPPGIVGDCDVACAGSPIAMPGGEHIERYNENYHSCSDEVLMGGLVVCGQAFMNGLKPNDGRTVVTYGKDAVYDPTYYLYGPNSPDGNKLDLAERSDDQVKRGRGAYGAIPEMYGRLNETALRHELLVAFDENQMEPIRIEGDLAAHPTFEEWNNPCRLTPNDEITWDPPAMRSTLDAVHSKFDFGVLPQEIVFRGGLRFRQTKRLKFAFFGASTRDGRDFATTTDALVNVSSEAWNTGYVFDPEKMTKGVKQHVGGIVCRGRAPVVVRHPHGTVSVPGPAFTLKRYNFAGCLYAEERIDDGQFEIREDEPLFLARIVR